MKYTSTLLSFPLIAQAARSIYTGFAYGAFWTDFANAKHKDDFYDGFTRARNLNTSITFDSARIFTCITSNTANDPIEAFDAAVESKTNLLLGFCIIPPSRDISPDAQVANEMLALEKGFKKHGQALSDLVIGLSVGNEDIYHWEDVKDAQNSPAPGNSAEVISATIEKVRKLIGNSSFAKYMQGKPIGHVDTYTHAAKVKGADFIGMTAYPWWAHENIENAKTSFLNSVEEMKQEAGNTPVWIAEMGWPFQSDLKDFPEASAETMQRYWNEAACAVLGRYTTFWYQLLRDSEVGQPDWGLLDAKTKQPRIKDLSCPGAIPSASDASNQPSQPPPSSTLIPPSTQVPLPTSSPPLTPPPPAPLSNISQSTTHVQSTSTTTVGPAPPSPTSSQVVHYTTITSYSTVTVINGLPLPNPTAAPHKTWCVTQADIFRDGKPVTVAGGPVGADGKCSSPPPYNGHPYITSGGNIKPTEVPKDSTWCVTMADIDCNGSAVPVDANPAGPDGKCISASTYNGHPYVTEISSVGHRPSAPPPSPPAPSASPSAPPALQPTTSASSSSPPASAPPSAPPAPSAPSAPPASQIHSICSRLSSKHAPSLSASSTAATSPQVPPTSTLPSLSLLSGTPAAKVRRAETENHEERRRWFSW